MRNTCYLRTNSLLKLRFPSSLTRNHWIIEEKNTKALHIVPLEGIMMAILCIKPITQAQLFEKIISEFPITQGELISMLEYLINKQIIFCIDKPEAVNACLAVVQDWDLVGWGMAAHYHFFTRDAPYIDYSEKGSAFEKVRNKMLEYHLAEPDVERCKKYATNLGTQQLPGMGDILFSYGFSTKT